MIYTIGHSTLTINEFSLLLEENKIDRLVDVRSHPESRRYPWFNKEEMEKWVADAGVSYGVLENLGGWSNKFTLYRDFAVLHGVNFDAYARDKFPKQVIAKTKDPSDKPTWTNQGLYDYQWFMTIPEFCLTAGNIAIIGQERNIALLCAEVLWWKCHRSMISDFLVFIGFDAIHLQPKITAHSKVIGNRLERYDIGVIKVWDEYKKNG